MDYLPTHSPKYLSTKIKSGIEWNWRRKVIWIPFKILLNVEFNVPGFDSQRIALDFTLKRRNVNWCQCQSMIYSYPFLKKDFGLCQSIKSMSIWKKNVRYMRYISKKYIHSLYSFRCNSCPGFWTLTWFGKSEKNMESLLWPNSRCWSSFFPRTFCFFSTSFNGTNWSCGNTTWKSVPSADWIRPS